MNRAAILTWFTGRARENAEHALDRLQASIEAGGWLPRASTKVKAAFNKASVIQKFARDHATIFDSIRMSDESQWTGPGRRLQHTLQYVQFGDIPRLDFEALYARAAKPEQTMVLGTAHAWAAAFAPVAAAVAELDATRPKPVFTSLGVSPTVTRTLHELGVDGKMETLRMPPIRWEKIERVDPKTGRTIFVSIGHIEWPPGTLHRCSRHATGQNFTRCHACGHAIRNPFNWLPLVVDGSDGVPRSLWVGRDCGENLFGVKASGELEYAGDELPPGRAAAG